MTPPGGAERAARLRVLTLARDAHLVHGGAERLAYEFARRLDRERFKSYLCTTHAPYAPWTETVAAEMDALRAAGVTVLTLGRTSWTSQAQWARLYALMARERIDVVHAHMPRASVPGSLLARLAHVPVIVAHEHGGTPLESKPLRRMVDRHVVARLSTVMVAVSDWDRQRLIALERIPHGRLRVIHNGIDPAAPSGRDVRPDFGVAPGVPLIGAIGRLFEQKGYHHLIAAVALLARRGRRLRCVIVGEGPERAALQELIEREELTGTVSLVGPRRDVPDVIAALDVALLPSVREGMPLALLEYMAGAAPIVATSVGGVPEVIVDARHGLLVPPADPAALAAAIARLLDDRPLAATLGAAARDRQRSEYDLDATVSRLEDLYVELAFAEGPARIRPAAASGRP